MLHGERSFLFEDSTHVTVSGFSFRQSTTLEVPPSCSHVRLTRNDFRLADAEGLHWVMVRGDDTVIDRNHFHGKTTLGVFLGIEGAGTEAMAQRVHVHRNHFSDHSFAGPTAASRSASASAPAPCPARTRSWSTTCSSGPTATPRPSR